MINVLFSGPEAIWPAYHDALLAAFAERDLEVSLSRDHEPDIVDYVVYSPNTVLTDFTPFTRTKAVLSLWAGVNVIVANETITQPLCRMVDPGLEQGMTEWVTGHVLRHHLGMDQHIDNPENVWSPCAPPLAHQRVVTVLGLGALGKASAEMLAHIGFQVRGWSQSEKNITGVETFNGPDGLRPALEGADIVVLLLPATPQTECIMNAETIAYLNEGAVIINPGRGTLIDDNDLLNALDTGQLGHATLDVFRTEPLPPEHPFWSDAKVTVTPHIASETRPDTASRQIAENIVRGEAGEPFLYLVDRERGY